METVTFIPKKCKFLYRTIVVLIIRVNISLQSSVEWSELGLVP